MKYKAVSLWQPWATLMAIGAKGNETRSWDTKHRGPLLIHAAKRWTMAQREFCKHPRVHKALEKAGIYSAELLPRGALLCLVELYEVISADWAVLELPTGALDADELVFGDYSPGRFIWRTRDVEAFETPIPYRGAQGLFEVTL